MNTYTLLLFLGFCVAIGYWSQARGHSFWFGFLWSFFLSPLVGFLIVLVVGKKNNTMQ